MARLRFTDNGSGETHLDPSRGIPWSSEAGVTGLGFAPIGGSSADYAENLRSETAKWAEVVRKANVKLD